MILGIFCFIGCLFTFLISLCLRVMASGVRITNRAMETGRNQLEQENKGRDAMNFTANSLRGLAKFFSHISRGLFALGGIGTLIMSAFFIIIVVVATVAGVLMNQNLYDAVQNNQSNTVNDCSASPSVGGYWEEIDFCFEEGVTRKVWGNANAVTDTSSAQYQLQHSPEYYTDDYGFGRIKDKDLGVDFFTIAWSKALFTEVGEKYRMTLKDDSGKEKVVYVIMVDERQAVHSQPDSKNKSAICYPSSAPAIAEFYLDKSKTLANHPEEGEQGGFINMGDVNCIKATSGEHDLRGWCVKIEHFLGMTGTEHKSQDEYDTDSKVIKPKYADGNSANGDVCVKENESVAIDGRILWVGDSRTVGLADATRANQQWDDTKDITNDALAKSSMGYDYFINTSIPEIKKQMKSGDTIVINYGVNGLGSSEDQVRKNADQYAEKINELAGEHKEQKWVYLSILPVDDDKAKYVKNNLIEVFNGEIQKKLDGNVTFVDCYTKIKNSEYLKQEVDSEGLHFSHPVDGKYHCYGMMYDAVRTGGKATVEASGVRINLDTRYYNQASDGIYGSAEGIAKLPDSISEPFVIRTKTYALGRAWQINNPNGLCPLPQGYSDYLAQGQKPKWQDGKEVKGLFTTRADVPIEHAIISYTDSKGKIKEAFIEDYSKDTDNIKISEVTGHNDKYGGFRVRNYKNLKMFLLERDAKLNALFQPIGDGH